MIKIYSFIAFFAFANMAIAQPVITNVVPNIGDSYIIKQHEVAPDPGSSGANVTWDFSGVTIDEYQAEVTVKNPSDVNGNTDFPDATHAMSLNLGFLTVNSFLSFTGNTFTEYGSLDEDGTFGTTYSDPKQHFTFPINYLDSGSDTYSGIVSSPGLNGSNVSGTTSYVADAYGTITTPSGTYENAIRYKVTGQEELVVFGTAMVSDITEYYWYTNAYPVPVFIIHKEVSSVMSMPTDSSNTTTMLMSYTSNPTGVDNLVTQNKMKLAPNPANDFIQIDFEFQGLALLRIYDATGKLLKENAIDSAERVDLTSLKSGIYIAEILVDDKHYAQQTFIRQ